MKLALLSFAFISICVLATPTIPRGREERNSGQLPSLHYMGNRNDIFRPLNSFPSKRGGSLGKEASGQLHSNAHEDGIPFPTQLRRDIDCLREIPHLPEPLARDIMGHIKTFLRTINKDAGTPIKGLSRKLRKGRTLIHDLDELIFAWDKLIPHTQKIMEMDKIEELERQRDVITYAISRGISALKNEGSDAGSKGAHEVLTKSVLKQDVQLIESIDLTKFDESTLFAHMEKFLLIFNSNIGDMSIEGLQEQLASGRNLEDRPDKLLRHWGRLVPYFNYVTEPDTVQQLRVLHGKIMGRIRYLQKLQSRQQED